MDKIILGIGGIFIAILLIIPFYGWINNLYQLTQTDFKSPYKAEILRSIGVVTIIPGVIMGFIEIKDN